MADHPKRHSSTPATPSTWILEKVRADAEARMRDRLTERSRLVDLYTEIEIDHLSRLCGTIAKKAAADGIAESYQLGVNRSIENEVYERDTVKPNPTPQPK